ncbi:hypothetical protein PG911_08340 [Tenacibaculum ovolyticum]|uniref:hypothetical protein n=1 Tax=Tenacibaculum ovolyticum TaxID=104270 RepID=UPI00048FCB99|nr:hypothetical protein [Tenacibaculum ovolyticum]WBX78252.1 hypothetical protein PG911_08340 [Tenacibaculum ovolyticum]
MYNFKKHIALIFILTLLTPTIVRASHDFFEDHEHITCTSKTDHHLHELENDCGDLHLQLKLFNCYFGNDYDLIQNVNYVNKSVEKPQQLNSLFFSRKFSRGPPCI